ncbi:hypothetical protein ACPRNU_02905 [Chromobacterium vaccinii]
MSLKARREMGYLYRLYPWLFQRELARCRGLKQWREGRAEARRLLY